MYDANPCLLPVFVSYPRFIKKTHIHTEQNEVNLTCSTGRGDYSQLLCVEYGSNCLSL